jgi:hypothetical protein
MNAIDASRFSPAGIWWFPYASVLASTQFLREEIVSLSLFIYSNATSAKR